MAAFTHYRVNTDHQVPIISGAAEKKTGFLDELNRKLQIKVTSLTEEDIEFDLIGVDASIANALRRILLAEVISCICGCLF